MTADSAPVTAREPQCKAVNEHGGWCCLLRDGHEGPHRHELLWTDADPNGVEFAAALLSPPSETREIERLRDENERLRELLAGLHGTVCGQLRWQRRWPRIDAMVRRALTATQEDRNEG